MCINNVCKKVTLSNIVKCETNLSNCFFVVEAAKVSNIKEKEVEDIIKKWLQGAPDREGGRKAREQMKKGWQLLNAYCVSLAKYFFSWL